MGMTERGTGRGLLSALLCSEEQSTEHHVGMNERGTGRGLLCALLCSEEQKVQSIMGE